MKKSKDFIRHYDNIMSPEICNAILDECKSLSFKALTRETPDGNYLTKERKCHGAPLPKQFENDMFESVGQILIKYSQDIKEFNMDNIQDTGYEILHYKSNEKGEFKSHVDHFDLYPRTLSISLLLNDDFDGGDFLFFDDQYKAPKKQGGAIGFPSNFCYPHRVSPVTKNDRYSIITWIH